MPFPSAVKTAMFIRCNRHCCLCLKQCGINIEVAHILDESAGGSNEEDNGIPLCFDCHQEIGSYNDKHPRGNKFRPEELRARRNQVFARVADGHLSVLRSGGPSRLIQRKMTLDGPGEKIEDPTPADVVVAVDRMTPDRWNVLILLDSAWDNAYVQGLFEDGVFWVEYRDGPTQMHYRARRRVSADVFKFVLLTYLYHGDALFRCAIAWDDVTSTA